ncbi:15284_t:CDS:2, partial [Funneliformis mosseae]
QHGINSTPSSNERQEFIQDPLDGQNAKSCAAPCKVCKESE